MTRDKLKRVCYLLRERHGQETFIRKDIDEAISEEVGTDRRTIRDNYWALKHWGYIKGIYGSGKYFITTRAGC
jgi:hypothetical protein